MTSRLDLVIAQARAAVNRGVPDSAKELGAAPFLEPDTRRSALSDLPGLAKMAASITQRMATPAIPMVKPGAESTLSRLEAPSWPSCEAVMGPTVLSRAARRVFDVLHGVAVMTGQARGYAVHPKAVIFHLPASLLALAVGYTDRHLRRILPELQAAGLLVCGAHAGLVNDMRLWDGYLWAVKVMPGETCPHLRREDWRHTWRDFAGDMKTGRTVKALLEQMSGLQTQERQDAVKAALESWAVTPGNLNNPVACSADIPAGAGPAAAQDMRQLAYRLGELIHVHPAHKAEQIGRTASALARLLNDPKSRRWYCQLLWEALKAEQEGRGGLSTLGAALARLEADRDEWAELRNPAALLASRLRSMA